MDAIVNSVHFEGVGIALAAIAAMLAAVLVVRKGMRMLISLLYGDEKDRSL